MDLSDRWVADGRRRDDPLLRQERRALVRSYTALRDATGRSGSRRAAPEAASARRAPDAAAAPLTGTACPRVRPDLRHDPFRATPAVLCAP